MDLLERDHDLERLRQHLVRAEGGAGSLVFIGGEAGIGKSALVRRFCDQQRRAARVLRGACDPLSTPRPLGPWIDIAAAAGDPLRRLVEEGTPRVSLFRGVLDALAAAPEPNLIVIEDAHWADEATLDLLRYLGRRIDSVRAVLLVTYRDDEAGPHHPLRAALGDLATASPVARMTLSPLSVTAVDTLATGSGLDPAALHRRTGGNPFFVTELLSAGGEALPATVRDAVLTRAARLSAAGRALLEMVAIIGARTALRLLITVAGEHADAVDECLAAGLLLGGDGEVAFRHEWVRTAVLEAISPLRAIRLHQTVLDALRADAEHADDLARLAHHAEAAGDQTAVLLYAPAAARRAAALGAHREAAAQYARAVRFAADRPPAERAPLLEASFLETFQTGQVDAAHAINEQLLALYRESGARERESAAAQNTDQSAPTLVAAVRQATEPYQDVAEAGAAGYAAMSCVSGPQTGAMGVHYIDGSLVGDGELVAERPEALLYEMTDGAMQLLGVEYIVLADDWHATNDAPPALLGQHFHHVGSPNRYGLPAFYELHVWAWKENPNGMFADWNPTVTCEEFAMAG